MSLQAFGKGRASGKHGAQNMEHRAQSMGQGAQSIGMEHGAHDKEKGARVSTLKASGGLRSSEQGS